MSDPQITSIAIALAVVMALKLATWYLGRRWRNYGIVDVVWSYLFCVVAWIYAGIGEGWPVRRWAIAGLVTIWSCRLGTHLLLRVWRHHPEEDRRYAELRSRWGAGADILMLGFYLLQGVLIIVLATPFLIATNDPASSWRPLEMVGLLLVMLAILGESVADVQLARSKQLGESLCRRGLWSVSRHPNYFFEWLVWVAFALIATPGPLGWIAWIAPALMWHFLVNVTGIPMTEELAVQRKGDAYREYQRTTSAFVPWFRKTI